MLKYLLRFLTLVVLSANTSASWTAGKVNSELQEKSHQPAMAKVSIADLPIQAQHTLKLISKGGPFPYKRDGVVFNNYEKLLPLRKRGYYREYTVVTPGKKTRGARRIVAGKAGELYYTADHYQSFKLIKP